MILDIIVTLEDKEKSVVNIYNKLEEELKSIKHNIIFVDNASSDKTLELLKNIQKDNESCVKIISFSKKFDKDTSIYAGVLHSKHDLICIYDTESATTHITKMYDYLKEHNECDEVCMTSNYVETNFFKKTYLKLFNRMFNLKYDINKSFYRMFRKNVKNAIIEYTKYNPFSVYTFEELGFNTYYLKYENKKIDKPNYCKLTNYSNSQYKIIQFCNLFLLGLTLIYFILIAFKLFKVSNTVILLFILLSIIVNVYLYSLVFKKKEKTYFLVKEMIGFDENVL